jgi:hypothetical protein
VRPNTLSELEETVRLSLDTFDMQQLRRQIDVSLDRQRAMQDFSLLRGQHIWNPLSPDDEEQDEDS